jgi:hypothetical protein
MKRVLALLCLACLTAAAAAQVDTTKMRIAPPPVPMKVATADAVVVGKVTGLDPKLVPADRFKNDKAQYKVATVKVEQALLGKGAKEVKVAFIQPAAPVPPPGGGVRPPIRRFPQLELKLNQEACFYLVKHPSKDFYTITSVDYVVPKDSPTFAKETAEAKRYVKLLADPKAGLKSKDVEERLTTAGMLLGRYRTQRVFTPNAKTYPVGSAESKLILETLADVDWAVKPGRNYMLNPQSLFLRLGLTPADGWTQPKNFRDFPAEAKKWLKANASKYRIKSYVPVVKGGAEAEPG